MKEWLRGSAHCRQQPPTPLPTPECSLSPLVLRAACCQHFPGTAWRGSKRVQAPWDGLQVLGTFMVFHQSLGRLLGKYRGFPASRGQVGQLGDMFSAPYRVSRCLSGNLLLNTPYSGFLSLLISPSHFLLVLLESSLLLTTCS